MIPTDFHFERPYWLLALVPAAVVLWCAVRAAGQGSAWRQAVDEHLLRHLALPGEGGAARWPLWLLGAGWLAAVLAMAGPSWERVPQPTTKTIEPTVVALDMSVSMDAEDVTPSRLSRARYKLQDVLARTVGGQVGLVIYSDEPFVASPLTDDGRVIAEMIPTLTSDIMPGKGSRPDRAIDQAVALLDQAGVPGGRVVLFADSTGDDPAATIAAAERAASTGRRVSVLGMGTEEGGSIPDGRGGFARTSEGEVYVARLPSDELRSLSTAGGGRYAQVSAGATDLDVLLAQPVQMSEWQDSTVGGADVEVWKDAGVYLLVVPLLLAPFAFRRGWLAVVLLAVLVGAPQPARASIWDDLWQTRDQQGAAALEGGDAVRASELFESADWQAAAEYESGDYQAAREQFASLPGLENRYNFGNALARSGQLEEAIAAYDEVLEGVPSHEDAKFNRDLVEQLLEQQEQQQQQQEQQQSQGGEGSEQQQQQDQQQSQDSSGDSESQQNAQQQQESQQAPGSESADGSEESSSEQASNQEQAGDESESEQTASASEQGAEEQEEGDRGGARRQSGQERSQEDYAKQQPDHGDAPNSMSEELDQALDGEPTEPTEQDQGSQTAAAPTHEPMTEDEQAREQMLRQIPDDPSGLLRAKIQRKYAEKRFAEQQRQLVRQGGTNPWW